MKIRLLQGKHFHNGRIYSKGEEIDLPEDCVAHLAAKHPGRFAPAVVVAPVVSAPSVPAVEKTGDDGGEVLSQSWKATEAIDLINGMATVEEIAAFIEGEERATVLAAAAKRKDDLSAQE